MLSNTKDSYGLIAKLMHWLIAIVIIYMIWMGFTMTNIIDPNKKMELYSLHKATGVLVLTFVTLRSLWRLTNTEVELPRSLPEWEQKLSKLNIILLYVLMFVMPISGLLMSILAGYGVDVYGLFTINYNIINKGLSKVFWYIHVNASLLFTTLIILHILAALYHHFIRKNNILIRMLK